MTEYFGVSGYLKEFVLQNIIKKLLENDLKTDLTDILVKRAVWVTPDGR